MMRLLSRAYCSCRGSPIALLTFSRHARNASAVWRPQHANATLFLDGPAALSPRLDAFARKGGSQWRSLATQASSGKAITGKGEEDVEAVGNFDEDEEDEELDEWEEFEDDVGQEVSTGGLDWGEKALAVVRQLLSEQEAFQDIELFSLRAIASGKRLDIRLDKMTDLYGSPSLDDIEAFSRAFNVQLEAELGEAAGEMEIEVSSPGAERAVRVPGELDRFGELPMKVEFNLPEDKVDTKVLSLESWDPDTGLTRWRLADVRANQGAGGKGRGLTKKQREQVFEISVGDLRRVNLHLDL